MQFVALLHRRASNCSLGFPLFGWGQAIVVLIWLLTTLAYGQEEMRTWQDASGKFKFPAKLVRVDGDVVLLAGKQGRQVRVAIAKLCKADQDYVDTRRERASRGEAPVMHDAMRLTAKLGIELVARDGPCSNVLCSFPLPQSWPEQEVTVLKKVHSDRVSRLTITQLTGARTARFLVKRLERGETASVVVHLDVKRLRISPPKDADSLLIAKKLSADLRQYLGESPFIETRHPKVRGAAEELTLDSEKSGWSQVRAIYDFTRRKVKYTGVRELQGALRGLESGGGDCEERTSVFVAMCRLKGIPARSVWVPGHTYPEFYLENEQGTGWWFPCESVADQFGRCGNSFLILQKGDRFRVPGHREPQRYVTATITGKLGAGSIPPQLRQIQDVKLVAPKN